MGIATKARMTEDEFMRMPDDGRKWELVNGEPKEVAAGVDHGAIGANIGYLFRPHTRGKGVLCGSDAGFRMASGNIRCPDVSYTRKERLPGGVAPQGFGDAAPDLCIEIISPSEENSEMTQKINEYFASGAVQVWHLFPLAEKARVYKSPTEYQDFGTEDEITGGAVLPDFRCIVSELFDDE